MKPDLALPPTTHRSAPDVAALAIILLALALSLIDLAAQSFWTDEGMAHFVAQLPVGEQFRLLRETAPNPLHYLLLGGWMRAAGNSEFALRFLSALGSALTVALVYRLGRDLGGRRAALIAAALLAINPLRIYYAQEARTYAWLTALAAASALLLWRSPRGLSAPQIIALGLLQALTCLAHPYGAFALIALNLVIFARLLRAPRGHLARWALSGLIAAVLAGAWFSGALDAIGGSAGSAIYFRGRLPATAVISDALRSYVLGFTGAGGDGWLLLMPALVGGLLALLFTRNRWPWLFILAGCVAPIAGILLLSGDRERYAARYVITGLLFFCLLVGQFAALPIVRRRWGALAYGLMVFTLGYGMMWATLGQFTDPALARPDFRAV
ncbi:MAG: glycosyltransferase family 39 protein, partial [Anaerolineae bacterium]|nr:glycosyltransferase family 39 protein [Anaerolineae bacterium]